MKQRLRLMAFAFALAALGGCASDRVAQHVQQREHAPRTGDSLGVAMFHNLASSETALTSALESPLDP